MPRDGSNIYSQPFPDVVEDTTIESTVYNGFTNDVAADLNAARPIVAGGTGATNAHDAMIALSGDIARQVVTNYDSHPFVSGSFYSVGGTTSEPVAGLAFAGACYVYDADARYMTLTGYIQNDAASPGRRYVRQKTPVGWSAWVHQAGSYDDVASAGDARYVNLTGDTMTGNLSVADSHLGFPFCVRTDGDTSLGVYSVVVGSVGLGALNDAQTAWKPIITNSQWFFYNSITVSTAGGGTGAYYFGNTGTKYLSYDGNNFVFSGGTVFMPSLNSSGAIQINGVATFASTLAVSTTAPIIHLNETDTGSNWYIVVDGSTLSFRYNSLGSSDVTFASGVSTFSGRIQSVTGYNCRSGTAGAFGSQVFNLFYNGGPVQLWIDNSNLGNITVTSDYRIKKDVIDLPGMWDTVKALRPIKYTQADFTPPSQLEYLANQKAEGKEVPKGPMFIADDVERWGFIAHELQETLVQSAATGVKDSPDCVQSPEWMSVVAALTKALQEAMARIEALEAR